MNTLLSQITVQQSELKIPQGDLSNASAHTILQIVFGIAGGIALLVIIIAALQFVLSQGDPQKTSKARNAIIYAIIGLVISILSFSIVTWVIGRTA